MNRHSPDDLGRLLDGSPPPGDAVDRSRTVLWQSAAAAVVAATVVLAVAIVRLLAPPTPPAVPAPPPLPLPAGSRPATLTGLAVRDHGALVGLRTDGSLSGLEGLAPDLREAVTEALRLGRLPVPAAAAGAGSGVAPGVGQDRTPSQAAEPSDLAAAVLAAQAGRYRDADAALARLAAANPTSATIETLRRELATRGGR
jgi:hypothetical protein